MRLTELPVLTCSCPTCVEMCEQSPCWPTPEQAERIMDAGYAPRLSAVEMNDYTHGRSRTTIIVPAVRGQEGQAVEQIKAAGRCTFLDRKGRCELHDLGLKPLEGQVVSHDTQYPRIHYELSDLWASTGNATVWRWDGARTL